MFHSTDGHVGLGEAEAGASSWGAGTQTLGLVSTAFPRSLPRNWIDMGAAGI